MARKWYKVRVREKIGLNQWVKKTRYYFVRNSGEAARKYKGPGDVMWVNKVSREEVYKTGEFWRQGPQLMAEIGGVQQQERGFLKLGDDLLRDIRREERRENAKSKEGVSETA